LRRCQILLASDRGKNAYQIAHQLGCNPQTARNAIHAFNEKGLPEALQPGSKHPHTVRRAFDPEQAEALRELLHHRPRKFGKDTSLWTLDLAAEVSFDRGGPHEGADNRRDRPGHPRAVGVGSALGAGQTLDHLPRSPLRKKKSRRDRLMEVAAVNPEWAVGFCDECWWSRLALPTLSSWTEEGKPLPLLQKSLAKDDPERSYEGHLLLRTLCAGDR
jgi:transposase